MAGKSMAGKSMDGKSMAEKSIEGNLMDEKSIVGISGSLNMQLIYRILLTIASTRQIQS